MRAEPHDDRRSFTIDCGTCELRMSDACDDCVVTFLCDRSHDRPVVVDLAEVRAMKVLGDAGLAPPLRHSAGAV